MNFRMKLFVVALCLILASVITVEGTGNKDRRRDSGFTSGGGDPLFLGKREAGFEARAKRSHVAKGLEGMGVPLFLGKREAGFEAMRAKRSHVAKGLEGMGVPLFLGK
ncbi:hypothetical protein WR25_19791 [Diploscapter pachys]|uniref:Uncharacterized protein n=1 Tax=Diploscapter pachys TaxID=2018661 RepID=A0A2A2JDQ1_9BILA|nr:hypothetical protein WR25_19791 [Diploscapter pachys]